MRFYCTSTDPIGGLNCEVLCYNSIAHSQVLVHLLFMCSSMYIRDVNTVYGVHVYSLCRLHG